MLTLEATTWISLHVFEERAKRTLQIARRWLYLAVPVVFALVFRITYVSRRLAHAGYEEHYRLTAIAVGLFLILVGATRGNRKATGLLASKGALLFYRELVERRILAAKSDLGGCWR